MISLGVFGKVTIFRNVHENRAVYMVPARRQLVRAGQAPGIHNFFSR